jgi:hypothetical protein
MRLPRGTRWATGAGVVLLLGIGTAGGMVTTAAAASGSSGAVSHTVTPVTTADVSFSVSVSGLTSSAVTITGTAQADFTNDAGALTVDLPAVVAKLIPGGSDAPETVNAVLSGGTVYLEIPSLSHRSVSRGSPSPCPRGPHRPFPECSPRSPPLSGT